MIKFVIVYTVIGQLFLQIDGTRLLEALLETEKVEVLQYQQQIIQLDQCACQTKYVESQLQHEGNQIYRALRNNYKIDTLVLQDHIPRQRITQIVIKFNKGPEIVEERTEIPSANVH